MHISNKKSDEQQNFVLKISISLANYCKYGANYCIDSIRIYCFFYFLTPIQGTDSLDLEELILFSIQQIFIDGKLNILSN